ncbi:MAG: hypothetical protein ACLPR9_06185 [Acidimicrobiales bacterium]
MPISKRYLGNMVDVDAPPMTASQVGRELKLSAERVRQLAREGKLPPAHTTPLGQLWDPVEVRRFAATRMHGGR